MQTERYLLVFGVSNTYTQCSGNGAAEAISEISFLKMVFRSQVYSDFCSSWFFCCFLSFPSSSSRSRFSTSFSFNMIKVNPEHSKLQERLIMHYALIQIFADSAALISRGAAHTFHGALCILELGSARRLISLSLSYQKV